ncbi:MAG: SIMPL domain-containing protein [Rhodobacterales bacterium]
MRIIALILIMALMPGVLSAEETPRRLTLVGTGSVFVAPDMATVSLGVSSLKKKASEAMQANSAVMGRVFEQLMAAGIKPRDIQTSQLSLNPRWASRNNNNTPPRIIGYQAVNTVTVRVRVVDRVGAILDVLTKVGANRINSIRFGIQTPRPHQDEARRRAVKDARAKAGLYAKAAGVELGRIISITENGGSPQPRKMVRMEMAAMASDVLPVAGGELKLRSSVTLVFEIK